MLLLSTLALASSQTTVRVQGRFVTLPIQVMVDRMRPDAVPSEEQIFQQRQREAEVTLRPVVEALDAQLQADRAALPWLAALLPMDAAEGQITQVPVQVVPCEPDPSGLVARTRPLVRSAESPSTRVDLLMHAWVGRAMDRRCGRAKPLEIPSGEVDATAAAALLADPDAVAALKQAGRLDAVLGALSE